MNNHFRNIIVVLIFCLGFIPSKTVAVELDFGVIGISAAVPLFVHGASVLLDQRFQFQLTKDRFSFAASLRGKKIEIGLNFWACLGGVAFANFSPKCRGYSKELLIGFLAYPLIANSIEGIHYVASHYKIVRKDSHEGNNK